MKRTIILLVLLVLMVLLVSGNAFQLDQELVKELRKGNFEKAKAMMQNKDYGAESIVKTVLQVITEYFQLELQQMAGYGSYGDDLKSKAVMLAQEFNIPAEGLKMPVFIGYAAAINNLNLEQLAKVKAYLKEPSLALAIVYYGHLQLGQYFNSENDIQMLIAKFKLLDMDLKSETVQVMVRDYLKEFLKEFALAQKSIRKERVPGGFEANKIKWLLKHFPETEELLINSLKPEFRDEYIDLLAKAKKTADK